MTSPDAINACFEVAGSALTWMNVRRVYQDKGYAGIYPPAIVIFWAWGIWNLYFYPHIDQWASFVGGCSLVAANTMWAMLMCRYGRKK